jgi:CHAD domain-containing protein
MARSQRKDLCREIQQCCHKLIADLNRDRRSVTTPAEMIHRLRVSCRQGEALLRWCRKPGRALERLRKVLRRIRRQAGPLRDADIVVMQLQALMPHQRSPSWLVLWGMAVQSHAHVAQAWSEVHEELYDRAAPMRSIIDKECKEKNITALRDKHCLAKLQHRYQQWKDVFDKAKKPELFHRLRIMGKRLRYALDTYPNTSLENKDRWLPWLKKVQDALGQWRDQQLLQSWILEVERYPVDDIVEMPDWRLFLRSRHQALGKQIKGSQVKIHRLLQKSPDWVDVTKRQ